MGTRECTHLVLESFQFPQTWSVERGTDWPFPLISNHRVRAVLVNSPAPTRAFKLGSSAEVDPGRCCFKLL